MTVHSNSTNSLSKAPAARRSFGRVILPAGFAAVILVAAGSSTRPTALGAKAPAAKPPEKKADAVPERRPATTPYRVRVAVSFAGSTEMLPAFRRRVLDDLREATAAGFGSMWDAEIVMNDWISPPTPTGIEQVTAERLLQQFPSAKRAGHEAYDKVFLMAVEFNGARFRMGCREWDVASQDLTTAEFATTRQRRLVGDTMYELLTRLFRPLLEVNTVSGYSVEFRPRAIAFAALDAAATQIRRDDVVMPFLRYLDKEGVVQRIQVIPWTYVIVDELDGHYVRGTLVSAYRSPLGSGKLRRVQMLALRVRPQRQSSRIKLVNQSKPLVGYNITLVKKRFHRDKAAEPPVKRFSGRDGYVEVDFDPKNPITWLYVYSGKALLARVPYVAGLAADETILLPDDSIRLLVEGEIALLNGRLIDAVASRAVLMALAIKVDNDKKLKGPEKESQKERIFESLERITTQREFLNELSTIRSSAVAATERLGNRFAKRRIEQMCDKTEELIKAYIKPGEVEQFKSDLKAGKYTD